MNSLDESASEVGEKRHFPVYKAHKLCYNIEEMRREPTAPLRPFRFAAHNFIQNHFSVPAGLVRRVKGNQVQILNDPVTVSGEIRRKIHCATGMRRSGMHPRSASQETCWKMRRIASEESGSPGQIDLVPCFAQLEAPAFRKKGGRFCCAEIYGCRPAGPTEALRPAILI